MTAMKTAEAWVEPGRASERSVVRSRVGEGNAAAAAAAASVDGRPSFSFRSPSFRAKLDSPALYDRTTLVRPPLLVPLQPFYRESAARDRAIIGRAPIRVTHSRSGMTNIIFQ